MNKIKLWSDVLTSLEKDVAKNVFNNYLKNTKILDSTDDNLVLEVSSKFHQDYIKNNLLSNIKNVINTIADKDLSILFNINSSSTDESHSSEAKKSPIEKAEKNELLSDNNVILEKIVKANLNPNLSFSNFVIGLNNQFVHAVAFAVADLPAQDYNPLFIYGGVGLGKSHILNAIGNKAILRNDKLVVLYVMAENFLNDMVHSIQNNKMEKFRTKYRKIDILLIDDIHILSGKERMQEEFFHTFNTLHNAGKQIVLTADKAPKEIQHLEERLRSRFQSGLLADIGLPDIETREAIIYKTLEMEKTKIDQEVVHFIAKKIKYNIRDIKGALKNLIVQSNLLNKPVDLNMAKAVIKNMIKENEKKETSITRIQEVVSDYFGVHTKQLLSKKRTSNIVLPRQVAMYVISELTNASTTEMGLAFGKRDHSTVIHAIEKIRNLKKMDKDLDKKIQKIIKELSTESV
ncbi:MAG: chromosomal replication initiator protein DnaA [Spirochaetes bacterium]|nr:chromosomal replication initiator protein DnaA [Spirochaetota bacterium]